MDTSTNVLGPNPVMVEVLKECTKLDLNQYPSPYSDGLRQALSEFYRLNADNFVVGNGSDEVLDIAFKTFLEPGESMVMPYPSYSLHGFFARINGGKVQMVDLKPGFQLDPKALLSAKGKLIILCTPNNPTGNTFRHQDVEKVIEGHDGPVVVDEAYGEFGSDTFLPLVDQYENLIVTRTFSKAYGLAGMRIGYLASNRTLADSMQRVKIPYSLNRVSERAAIAALTNRAYLNETVELIKRERKVLAQGLKDLGLEVFPTESNFMMFRSPKPSAELVSKLAGKGVLIRDFGKMRMLENCVRTTIGTEELNQLLLSKLKEVLEEW